MSASNNPLRLATAAPRHGRDGKISKFGLASEQGNYYIRAQMSTSSSATGADTRAGNGRFEQTQWTVILKARDEGATGAVEAMETFARSYWPPIYRYIRRDGYGRDDAQDLTQSFYQHLLRKQFFERRWAQAVFTDAMNRLRADYQRRGQGALFEELKNLQPGNHGERSHAVIARPLGMTEQAIKNAVLTFRRRYADCLRRQVARTVETPGEVHEELNHLIQIFGS
jgi:hypothetical protein